MCIRDSISGSGQTEAAHKLCSGIVRKEHHHLEVKGAGHYGIFSGRRWREVVYPKVTAFILQHAQQQAAAKPLTSVARSANTPKSAPKAAPKVASRAAAKPAPRKATSAKSAVKTQWVKAKA